MIEKKIRLKQHPRHLDMLKYRDFKVRGLKFRACFYGMYMLISIKIDNITIMIKHSFTGLDVCGPEPLNLFKSSMPEEIAAREYNWLKPLLNNRSQIKEEE